MIINIHQRTRYPLEKYESVIKKIANMIVHHNLEAEFFFNVNLKPTKFKWFDDENVAKYVEEISMKWQSEDIVDDCGVPVLPQALPYINPQPNLEDETNEIESKEELKMFLDEQDKNF